MIGDGGDVETAFCNHPLAGGVSLKSRFGEHMIGLLMKHMKLGDVKDPGKHERGWMSAILKPFGGGISMTFFLLDAVDLPPEF